MTFTDPPLWNLMIQRHVATFFFIIYAPKSQNTSFSLSLVHSRVNTADRDIFSFARCVWKLCPSAGRPGLYVCVCVHPYLISLITTLLSLIASSIRKKASDTVYFCSGKTLLWAFPLDSTWNANWMQDVRLWSESIFHPNDTERQHMVQCVVESASCCEMPILAVFKDG